MLKLLAPVVLAVALAARAGEADELADAPPNAWVKVESADTGGRHSPIFFYEPGLEAFVMTGGMPGGGYHQARRHFDTEHLDPATWAWTNAYPPGLPYQPGSGVTDAPAPDMDKERRPLWSDRDVLRVTVSGGGLDTRAHFQWAYDADSATLLAYLWDKTLAYDPGRRAWLDTGAAPFSKAGHDRFPMAWGSLCYDPVNKQVVSVGGSSDEPGGTPGTWAYDVAEGAWEKLESGSAEMNRLRRGATEVRRRGWALLSASRSRFFITETPREAEARLSGEAADVVAGIDQLARQLAAADLPAGEGGQARRAGTALAAASDAVTKLAGSLDGPLNAEALAALKEAIEPLDRACDYLAVEPGGRAGSQMAYDAARKTIVLFGGNELDRVRADTWLYDCPTRTWRQVFPKLSPAPRAGHCLAYLPESGRVALAGGYAFGDGWFKELPGELWTYDVGANEWGLLTTWDLPAGDAPRSGPVGYVDGNYSGAGSPCVGAATPDDVLVMVDTGGEGRTTWACKADPSKVDEAKTTERGVADGAAAVVWSHPGPASWEKDARPDPAPVAEFYENLPANQWVALPKLNAPVHRAWNGTAFDPDRRQFLYWGGGHVTYMGTDVAHYSVRSNLWTTSYPPDLPIEPAGGFAVKAARSFGDRPQIPVHAYRAYAYNPPSGLMLYLDRGYDVAGREWEPQAFPVEHGGSMYTLLETTPAGAVLWSAAGLFRFDAAARAWKKLPYEGPDLGRPWCDGHALCYDSRRHCLWIAPGTKVYRYDFAAGRCQEVAAASPKALGEYALWHEQVYVPEADLILIANLFKAPDGRMKHAAFDPAAATWHWVELPVVADGQTLSFDENPFSWDSALHYDPASKTVLHHWGRSTAQRVLALRLDRAGAKMSEIED